LNYEIVEKFLADWKEAFSEKYNETLKVKEDKAEE